MMLMELINAGIPSEAAIDMTRMMVQNRFREEHTIRAQNMIFNAIIDRITL